jgi:hypothetical protein
MTSDAASAASQLVQDADIQTIWNADLHTVGCLTCGVAHLVPAGWKASRPGPRCPACLAESLGSQPARLRPEPPEMVVPFAHNLTPARLSAALAEWLRGVWLRPSDLGVEQLLSRLMRAYLPMWLVDGQVVGVWQAQMGFDYQVQSTQERFKEDQGWTARHLTETRVRWEPRVGRLTRTYHNLTVPALEEREEATLMARLGRYDLGQAVAYTPAAVADAAVRVPSLLPDEAWPLARAALDRSAADDCQRAASAQHSDEFTLNADYHDLTWTQLLLPFYVTYYKDDTGRVIPVWVNGQNGHASGVRRASLRKGWRVAGVVGAVAVVTFLAGVLLALLGVETAASVLTTTGFFLAIVAALPVLWVWQFNQQQSRF